MSTETNRHPGYPWPESLGPKPGFIDGQLVYVPTREETWAEEQERRATNLHDSMTAVLTRLEQQAERAGTDDTPWKDAADMVRDALTGGDGTTGGTVSS